ncbi:flavin reductase family protein [Sporomusa aerivorans]|uniref:flavin reductase family protein n=1 Tax=Sporomusa aerivorans TaxID=204936 RepID=UPI00352AAE8D
MKKSLGSKPWALPSPVWVVGTYGDDGQPNMMTLSWGGICSSDPPCVAISVRKSRLTYSNIIKRKAFTINIPSKQHLTAVDYAGIASGKHADKFLAAGLTPIQSDLVQAPYAEEFPLILECRLLHTVEIGVHTQFIGEILDVKAEAAVLNEQKCPVIELINPIISTAPDRKYYEVGGCLGQAYHTGLKIVGTKIK